MCLIDMRTPEWLIYVTSQTGQATNPTSSFLAHSLHQPLPDSCSRANHPVSLSYYMPAPASSFSSESKSPYNDLDKDARRIPLVKRFQQLANNIFNHL
jgi:hypothetical protein